MDAARLEAHLRERLPALRGKLSLGADMAKITWFRTGGPAELLFQPADEADLAAFLAELPAEVPLTVVGIGSNLLVRDGGIDGVVVKLPPKGFGEAAAIGGNRLRVGAGVSDKRVSTLALEEGLAGFHFLAGIPGSIGGALRMNAGANGVETAERFVEAVALDRKGRRHVLSSADMGFSYRHTDVPDDFIFVSAVLEGEPGTRDAIAASIEEVRHHRETVQPVREKTGGSTFRNPPGTSAWKEIDRAGCRGFSVGGARMSEMHCNFMINEADASAHDLELLGESVRERVFRASGILLHWEIARIGRFEAGREVSPFVP